VLELVKSFQKPAQGSRKFGFENWRKVSRGDAEARRRKNRIIAII
jgi:hypothetical protein